MDIRSMPDGKRSRPLSGIRTGSRGRQDHRHFHRAFWWLDAGRVDLNPTQVLSTEECPSSYPKVNLHLDGSIRPRPAPSKSPSKDLQDDSDGATRSPSTILHTLNYYRRPAYLYSKANMSTADCSGYHWSQGQYVLSNCGQESSTFFIVLGFTMLFLVLLLFVIVIIACVRRNRMRTRARQRPPSVASEAVEDDCVINLDGLGPTEESPNGRNLENVKTVIMAGEEKPTYIAHPVSPGSPFSELSLDDEEQEVNSNEPAGLAVVPHAVV